MSFLSVLETIGKDILVGIELAAPIVIDFVPAAGPILQDIADIIAGLEAGAAAVPLTSPGKTPPTEAQIHTMVQSIAFVNVLKQHAGK